MSFLLRLPNPDDTPFILAILLLVGYVILKNIFK
jgi:hypothetical protein